MIIPQHVRLELECGHELIVTIKADTLQARQWVKDAGSTICVRCQMLVEIQPDR